ncbi:MAG: tRNA (adenosine(37)-N6)-threonylcarbamoyltransferase complex ATPase subunit type 1 TsaE [Acidimicrobiia bacterium]|nr:tRNA (adenosine(37)-N6)-threonylcarbamoyltransferase complex ATPase subunit type 1 TsaE [Acidimicrobiia bacterium]
MIAIAAESPEATRAVGRRLAGLLRPGDIVLLAGRLGSGKTVFAAGVADGLGVDEPVTSPTFVLVHEHQGFLPVIHADVYRLGSSAEFDDLELPSAADDGVLLVEWGNAVASSVPPDHLMVELVVVSETERRIELTPMGTWDTRPLEEITA